ncbi:heterokaryon incompatibility Het-C [Myriangium duriaei CBS 260.36]|uniref:Heterokaryon incompatibility Het-C n=1 Tax=Myriangium duriaei CBS 260.36 TaxID=1168546 RepID=A0A9P4J0S6_9PEZI|nr:heterokaryon incompatibility Het-C [Myriangium duriaei CBS 260.36]
MSYSRTLFLLVAVGLVLLPQVSAFGAGNIASIAKIEGKNWRHGDIEDTLKMVACLKGHKWSSMMIKRVYFGNWLRDYSQAVDVGTLTKVQGGMIRILVWILGFMTFGYATEEFEVTEARLGCYRPEEHIDNPKDYADNQDARQYDKRLRGPVRREELEIDPRTGMKNYIANESGDWATSSGYVKYSFSRSIHFGRLYTKGPNPGREEDLCEALRCLGQGLHCLEDFGAHTQYVELALRELGCHNVFPHVGDATEINLNGKRVFPLVTGTFGGVDFLHSVIGEVSDHVTQSEVDDMNDALGQASNGKRSTGGSSAELGDLTSLLSKIPGTGDLAEQAERLQRDADQQQAANQHQGYQGGSSDRAFNPMSAMSGGSGGSGGTKITATTDPEEIVKKIYPILQFRDKVVRAISAIISKIPGLESLVDKITETVTLFVMRLLAPYVMPLIGLASQGLKQGSSGVIQSSANQQYIVFDDPHSSDPTHSMLSKDHFSNILNEPAGRVAAEILKYAAPRVVYAWENIDVPVHEVVNDVVRTFHHPATRDMNLDIHRNMFSVVEQWHQANRGSNVENLLSKDSVRHGKNHRAEKIPEGGIPNPFGGPGAVLGGGKRDLGAGEGEASFSGAGGHAHGGHSHGASYGRQDDYESAGGYGGSNFSQPQSGYGGGAYGQQSAGQGYGEESYGRPPQGQGYDQSGGYGGGGYGQSGGEYEQGGYGQQQGGYQGGQGYGQQGGYERRDEYGQGGYGGQGGGGYGRY